MNKLRAQGSEKREGAGRLRARTPESREERERPGTRLHSHSGHATPRPRIPPPPAGPDPHTQARVCTRARTRRHAHVCVHTQALPRALTPAHTQGYNKGRGASAALLFSLFSSLLQPPSPGPACPAHPALRTRPTAAAAGVPGLRVGAATSLPGARASQPRAGGRQKLRRRRRPRGQGVLANCQEMCVCAPGARRGGEGTAGGREGTRRPTPPHTPPVPAARQRRAPEPGLENKLSALFSLGCG